MVKSSPIAAGWPSRPTNAAAKSSVWVSVHWVVPSPCTTTGLPARIRATSVQWPMVGSSVLSYVCDGRTIVAGNPDSR